MFFRLLFFFSGAPPPLPCVDPLSLILTSSPAAMSDGGLWGPLLLYAPPPEEYAGSGVGVRGAGAGEAGVAEVSGGDDM
jgi:hypothetical protein